MIIVTGIIIVNSNLLHYWNRRIMAGIKVEGAGMKSEVAEQHAKIKSTEEKLMVWVDS